MTTLPPQWFKPINYIQNTEILVSNTTQYLKIHKNGCTFTEKCLELNNPNPLITSFTTKPYLNKTLWTVIRDPYKRFISGLAHDIGLNRKNENLEEIVFNLNFKKLFLGKLHPKTRKEGYINHCLLQFTYLFNHQIDFCVDIEDLNTFSKIHFKNVPQYSNSSQFLLLKDQIQEIIKSNLKIKSIIENYLSIDYYIIEELYSNNLVWNWQNGKMF